MLDHNTSDLVSVSVASVIRSGAGFGVVIGTGSNCIIPSRVVYAADLEPGDLIRCRLIDNPQEDFRDRTPYMVSYVDPNATAALRLLVSGGVSVHAASSTNPAQLELPLEPQVPPTVAPPAPVAHTLVTIKNGVSNLMDTGGLWSIGDLRDELWPDEEFGSDDYRYKLLTNAVRDLHNAALVTAFGRRKSYKGVLACVQYTKFPDQVRILWSGPVVQEAANV